MLGDGLRKEGRDAVPDRSTARLPTSQIDVRGSSPFPAVPFSCKMLPMLGYGGRDKMRFRGFFMILKPLFFALLVIANAATFPQFASAQQFIPVRVASMDSLHSR